VPTLMKTLSDTSVDVRKAAVRALGEIDPESKTVLSALIRIAGDQHEHEAVRYSALSRLMTDKDPRSGWGILPSEGLIEPIIKRACEAHDLPYRPRVSTLVSLLRDSRSYERLFAARALAEIGPEAKAAVPALEKLLKDETDYVRQAAAYALKRIRGEE